MAISDLSHYITTQRAQGISDDQIRAALIEKGWKRVLIDEAFAPESASKTLATGSVGFFRTFVLVITNPRQLFAMARNAPLKDAIIYYTIFVCTAAIINLAITVMYLGSVSMIAPQVFASVGMSFGGLLIISGLTHGGCRLLRGRGTYAQTLKAMIYGSTPSFAVNILAILLGVGGLVAGGYYGTRIVGLLGAVIAGAWSFVTIVRGLREYHSMSIFRVIVALIFPAIAVLLILILFLLSYFGGYY